jgi:hypothetical protein
MTETTETAQAVTDDTTLDQTAGEELNTAQEGQDTGDDGAAEQVEGEGEQPPAKPKKTVQDRIDEMTRARRDAEREAEYWRAKALQAPERQQPEQQAQPKPDAPPNPADFDYGDADPAYIAALVDHKVKAELKAFRAQAQAEAQAQTADQQFKAKEAQFAAAKPDFQTVVYDSRWDCTPVMADAIKQANDGPAVAYHLASNPAEARRIAALNPLAQALEIGRLEARLSTPAVPQPKTVSEAPPPPNGVRGAGGRFKPAPDTTDFAAFEKAY